jgi:hypothetical protein
MPYMEPLKKAEPPTKVKRTAGTPPGGGRPKKVRLATRDPRRKRG